MVGAWVAFSGTAAAQGTPTQGTTAQPTPAQGAPAAVLTQALVREVFALECRIIADPYFGTPLCIPFGREVPPCA